MEEKETRAKQLMSMLKKKNQSNNNSAITQKPAEPEQPLQKSPDKKTFFSLSSTSINPSEGKKEEHTEPPNIQQTQSIQTSAQADQKQTDKTRAKQLISILKKNSSQTQIKEEEMEGEKMQNVPSPIVSKDAKKIFFGRERYKPKVEKQKLTVKEQEKKEEKLLGKKQGIRGMFYRRLAKKGEEETQQ